MISIAVTGHRPDKLWGYDLSHPKWIKLKQYFIDVIKNQFLPQDSVEMISGMALGTDTVFAQAAIALKEEGYPIKFTAAVPFTGQESKWPNASQAIYRNLLAKADEIHTVCDGGYAAWKMQKRNEWMVDRADTVIAVWDGTSGGTANCVKYVEKLRKPLITIIPKDF